MAEPISNEDSPQEQHAKIAQIFQTKSYIDDPEVLPWYQKDLAEVKPKTRELLEKYSNIAPADVESHVKKVRDDAFKVFPYPCLGNWGFLNLSLTDNPVYTEVLERIQRGESYHDIGCCMGQDIRKLVHDGAPAENMTGSDLKGNFWDISYDLFRDKDTLKTKFFEADVLDPESSLKELDGTVDIINTASFFHLWDWNNQVKVAKRVIQLLKAQPGVMIVGRQGGRIEAGDFLNNSKENAAYWHNPESWTKLWKQVSEETDTKWKVDASLGEEDTAKRMKMNFVPAGTRFMTFHIRRI